MSDHVDIDLGDNHTLRFTRWKPDRDLNPKRAHLPDVEKYGAIVSHTRAGGATETHTGLCEGGITFDGPVQREIEPSVPKWQVLSWEPLTLTPSLLCRCGDHGFIREGKWVRA